MKKLLLTVIICLCSSVLLFAQEEEKSYSSGKMVYAELGGPGVLFSFNFDSRFSSKTNLGLGYRVGLGFSFADGYDYYYDEGHYSNKTTSYATIPLGLNYIFGKPNSPHTFEVGVGATILTKKMHIFTPDNAQQTGEGGNIIGHSTFMYRRQPINGGFTWRIGLVPILGTSKDVMLSAAVGVGYAF